MIDLRYRVSLKISKYFSESEIQFGVIIDSNNVFRHFHPRKASLTVLLRLANISLVFIEFYHLPNSSSLDTFVKTSIELFHYECMSEDPLLCGLEKQLKLFILEFGKFFLLPSTVHGNSFLYF
jgi:hypothetical protein